jgi:flagellar basal-body rod protein FlgF/flagellar basal-body rod protein FlgG
MPYGLYISAEGAHVQDKRMQVISNNLANVDTVGFKRELAAFQSRYAEAIEQGMVSPGMGMMEDVGGGVMMRQTMTDFSPGPLKRTNIPTDMAVEGEGFFVVQKGDETFLTRAGNFRLTNSGQLQTQQGYAVLNETGTPVTINPDGGPWQLTPGGGITQAGGAVQNLALVVPASMNELVKTGENLFKPLGETEALAVDKRRVAHGYQELSGVKPTTEMIELIETSRILEANISLMKSQDQMLSGLVNRVLKV